MPSWANYYVKELFPNTGRLLPGRRGDKRRDWLVVGPEDEVDLVDYLETGGPDGDPMIPVVLNGAGAAELTWTLLREKPVPRWKIEVSYKDGKPPVGEFRMSWDTTGATVRVLQSKSTRNVYTAAGFTAPDFQGAIGIRDGEPEGCDVVVSALKLTVDATIHASFIDMDYLRTLSEITGRVNSTSIWNFAAGELLFLGSSGSIQLPLDYDAEWRSENNLQIQFTFLASKNATGLAVGPITGITKQGHDYLWLLQLPAKSANRKALVAKAAYVEQVYHSHDLRSTLKIGAMPV